MKQHITVEQLNELSENQKTKLIAWWTPNDGDIVIVDGFEGEQVLYNDEEYVSFNPTAKTIYGYSFHNEEHLMAPLLSIGQMIELLLFAGGRHMLNFMEECMKTSSFREDILWQAVKEVL